MLICQHILLHSAFGFGSAGAMTLPPTWDLFDDAHLPHRILLLARMLDRETARHLQEHFALTLAEWRVLAFVCSVGPSSAADIGSAFEVDRAEVSRAVARLEARGLILRETAPDNRKKMILQPTPPGRETFERARLTRQKYFETILQDLDAGQVHTLNEGLQRIARRVKSTA